MAGNQWQAQASELNQAADTGLNADNHPFHALVLHCIVIVDLRICKFLIRRVGNCIARLPDACIERG